ncbi:MAG: YceI family protein [Bacteroidetes bacterium]|nr:YceI family protein [Bacteroidota bacterium]
MGQSQQITGEKVSIKWTGNKVGGSHYGTIDLKEGNLKWDHDQITSGKFVVDMQSIKNIDLTDAGYNKKLVDHLKSSDFFGVEEFPEAVLEITEGTVLSINKYKLMANLTIRGITHPIEFDALKEGDKLMAKLTIDRSKYEVKYRSKSFFQNLGDKLIYDDFTLEIVVTK